MKRKVLLASFSMIPLFGLLAQNQEPQAPEILPELPESQSSKTPTATDKSYTPSSLTAEPEAATTLSPQRRMPTAEELEKVRKDRNWMVEGMKEKEAARLEAASASKNSTRMQNPGDTDMSQSIIDMVLNKDKKPSSRNQTKVDKKGNPTSTDSSSQMFKPVITTNSFDNSSSAGLNSENSITSSILEQERAQAKRAGFKEPRNASNSSPMKDPFANPFSNLPIPEDALPRSQPMTLQGSSSLSPSGSPLVVQNATPGNEFSGNLPSAAGRGNPSNNNGLVPASVVSSNPGPTAAPRAAIEQPYAILREQELIQRQQQLNSNSKPRAQDLRSTVRDPNEARLF